MDPTAIGNQIERILRSRSFATKSQLRRLLQLLARNIDSQTTLTPEFVIKGLWPEEIKTKRSADVATEMNRLRHALESYYEGEGQSEPVTIFLPNRAAPGPDGLPEKRWIAARSHEPGEGAEEEHAVAPVEATQRSTLEIVGVLVGLGAAIGIVAYLFIRMLAAPGQPKLGRLDGSALVIMNAEGKELWRKSFARGFGPASYYAQGLASRIWFTDLEGKGHTSVLFSYLPVPDAQPQSSTLICYSSAGKEKWRWRPGRYLPELANRFEPSGGPTTFKTSSLVMLKAAEKEPSRIVVQSDLDPWWGGPSQVAVLDPNGKMLSEYWHSGGLRDMAVADLEGNGREAIIAAGVAHGYDSQATLVVLDADQVRGASKEVVPQFQIHGMGDAPERLRLLFPRSDLNRAAFQYDYGIEPTFQNGRLQVTVLECVAPIGCPVRYEFDRELNLIAAYLGNDEFRSAHDRFYQKGKDAHAFSAEEQAAFLKIRCLAGCKSEFVPVAQIYDPAATFEKVWSTQRNSSDVWSYGYSSGFAESITLYDKTVQNGINGPNAQYWLSSSVNNGTSPAAEYNNGPAIDDGNINFLANEFLLVAGIGGQYSNLIFNAPAAGEYSITGNFRGAQYGIGTVVGMVADGKVVFSSSVTSVGQLVPFRLTVALKAGSKVVFSVGPGSGRQNTGLSATITRPCALTDRPVAAPTGQITCSRRLTGE